MDVILIFQINMNESIMFINRDRNIYLIRNLLQNLQKQCLNAIDEINHARFEDIVGTDEVTSEHHRRASLAFKVFEDIYAFARDAW